jgi:uncharacterized membrane protein HdeD (DUF308 family)
MIEGFLIGVIATTSVVAGLFFLRFWKRTQDPLFLAFGIAFLIEGINRVRFLSLADPAEGEPSIYLIRLLAYLLIAGAIIHKNLRRARA